MTRDEVLAMFERRRIAFEQHDVATLMLDYTEDCVVESPSAGTHTGRKAIEQIIHGVFNALDIRVRQQSLLVDGNHVAMVLQMEGKDIGHFLGMPPTGKSFQAPAVFLFELKDDKIVRERRIYDFTGMMMQIGLLKAKLAV